MRKFEVIKIIGKKRWREFEDFMAGQTVGKYKNYAYDYYPQDVENFLRPANHRFFD